ncbi:hypothetical protein GE061_003193 [Apolygus lucorum]|uniref:Prefoldin subunit 4 n=1 Tax=Apolygus lucorum TaxID=248454 RepID=A0A6A4JG92_APOLU|nr:hypothetical protein GE061_003193 [Apolygus lucorum]
MTTIKSSEGDTEVNVLLEDQKKINRFARLHAKNDEISQEINDKKNELKNLDDAIDEMELMDDEEEVPFVVGESHIFETAATAKENIENIKKKVLDSIGDLQKTIDEQNAEMSNLKAELYAKFGNNINLEKED